jgi:hypothetical protein
LLPLNGFGILSNHNGTEGSSSSAGGSILMVSNSGHSFMLLLLAEYITVFFAENGLRGELQSPLHCRADRQCEALLCHTAIFLYYASLAVPSAAGAVDTERAKRNDL